MNEYTKTEWEEVVNRFGENIKNILKEHLFDRKTLFEIEEKYEVSKKEIKTIEILFYDFLKKNNKI